MFTTYVLVTFATIAVNAAAAIADFVRARFVYANAAELDLPQSWIPTLGLLKAAGCVGLVLGLVGIRFVGVAAAIGLTLFFACAVAIHVRKRVFHNIAAPGGFLALAVGSLVLAFAY